MTIHEIARVKLQGTIEAPATSMADEAAEVLGYAADKRTVVAAGPLATVLAALDIDVLDWRAVRRYQLDTASAANIARLAQGQPSFDDWNNDLDWRKTAIDKYSEPIPDFVLNKAIQIKRAMPEVEILVEALQENPDPFLVVRRKDGYRYEGYYVEVWDETSFERL